MLMTVPHGYSLIFRVCRQMELYKLRRKGFLSSSKPTKRNLCIKTLSKHIDQRGEVQFYSNVLSLSTNLDWILYYFCKCVVTEPEEEPRIVLLLVKTTDLLDPLLVLPRTSSAYKSCLLAEEMVAIGTLNVYRFWTFSLCAEPTFVDGVATLFSAMYEDRIEPPFPYEMWNGSLNVLGKWKGNLCRKRQWHRWTPKPYKKSNFFHSVQHLRTYQMTMGSEGMVPVESLNPVPLVSMEADEDPESFSEEEAEEVEEEEEESLFTTSDSYDLMESEDELEEMLLKLNLHPGKGRITTGK